MVSVFYPSLLTSQQRIQHLVPSGVYIWFSTKTPKLNIFLNVPLCGAYCCLPTLFSSSHFPVQYEIFVSMEVIWLPTSQSWNKAKNSWWQHVPYYFSPLRRKSQKPKMTATMKKAAVADTVTFKNQQKTHFHSTQVESQSWSKKQKKETVLKLRDAYEDIMLVDEDCLMISDWQSSHQALLRKNMRNAGRSKKNFAWRNWHLRMQSGINSAGVSRSQSWVICKLWEQYKPWSWWKLTIL